MSLPPSCLGCIPAPHRLQVRPRLAPRRRAAAFELTAKEAGSVSSHPPSRPQARCGCGTTTRANACARTAATRTQSTHPRPLTLPHVVPLCPVATLPRPFRDLSETFPRPFRETLPQVLLRRRLRHVLRPAPDRVGVRGADTPPLRLATHLPAHAPPSHPAAQAREECRPTFGLLPSRCPPPPQDGHILLWDLQTKAVAQELTGHSDAVLGVSVSRPPPPNSAPPPRRSHRSEPTSTHTHTHTHKSHTHTHTHTHTNHTHTHTHTHTQTH